MKKILLCLLLAGCSQPQEPISNWDYYHCFFLFSRTDKFIDSIAQYVNARIEIVVNGRVLNLTSNEYQIFPRLKLYLGRSNFNSGNVWTVRDGALGYTNTEDWSNFISTDDRWQSLSEIHPTLRPNEVLRIKIFTGKLFASDSVFYRLVFVVNNKEQTEQLQVNF